MLLSQRGGLAGVRDEGLLDSALSRPENLFAYGNAFEVNATRQKPICVCRATIPGSASSGLQTTVQFNLVHIASTDD